MKQIFLVCVCVLAVSLGTGSIVRGEVNATAQTYSQTEIGQTVEEFFAQTSSGVASVVESIFSRYGRPNGYIKGTEGSGALIFGLRYGEGELHMKSGESRKVFWQGPSIGWDIGANASKVFTLVYNLQNIDELYQRFPGVDGSLYVIGGLSVNAQRSLDITLVPIRSGAGLRLGANVGYLQYTKERGINPF